jgi:small-conductance mechanosensitive channel
LLLHHVDVEDELDKTLYCNWQLALIELLSRIGLILALFFILLIIFILLFLDLVVELDLLVISLMALLVVLAVILPDGMRYIKWSDPAHLSSDTHPAPPGKEIAGIGIAVLLDDL